MKLFKNFYFIIVLLTLSLNNSYSQNRTLSYMLSSLDGNTSKTYITRTQSLLNQLSTKYKITETEVGDKIVVLCYDILRDKYGIDQKIQFTMEGINRIRMSSPNKKDFDKLLVVYGVMRDSGQSNDEAITRLNMALEMNRKALDIFLDQE